MQFHQIDETEIMQQNLQKLIKNQNYFSCFIESAKREEQPTNPFQKKMFDKNLRRSAISCGHYGSVSHNQSSHFEQSNRLSSSRRNSFVLDMKNNQPTSESNIHFNQMPHPKISTSHKLINLTQSRHSDPIKQQITQIINNFRLQLDYLQQKLHNKIDQLNIKYGDRQCDQKNREGQFMIQSLEKIVGFMVENCVNLEDSVMYGEEDGEEDNSKNHVNDTARSNQEVMRREVYQIQEDQNQQQQNMSFNQQSHNFKPTHRFVTNHNTHQTTVNPINKKTKIVGFIEKENIDSNSNNHNHEDLPQTYYINSKLHSTITDTKKTDLKAQNHTIRNSHEHSTKPTKRAPSKQSSRKPPHTSTQNESYHYHSAKDTTSHASQSSNSLHESNHPNKSIYETVLEQREMRLKMKKKIV